jgi:hypothetical protein
MGHAGIKEKAREREKNGFILEIPPNFQRKLLTQQTYIRPYGLTGPLYSTKPKRNALVNNLLFEYKVRKSTIPMRGGVNYQEGYRYSLWYTIPNLPHIADHRVPRRNPGNNDGSPHTIHNRCSLYRGTECSPSICNS